MEIHVRQIFEQLLEGYILEFGPEQGPKELAIELKAIATKALARLLNDFNAQNN